MQQVLERIRREPVLVATVVIAVSNLLFDLPSEDSAQLTLVLETLIVLIGGGVARQRVAPICEGAGRGEPAGEPSAPTGRAG